MMSICSQFQRQHQECSVMWAFVNVMLNHRFVPYEQCICRLADNLLTFCVLVSPFPSSISVCVESTIAFHFHPVIWFSVIWITDAVLKCTNTVFSLTVLLFILSLYFIPVRCSASPTLLWPMESRESHIHTGCHRRKGPNFGRVLLMLNCTDITQNTYIQSWTVTEIMAREKCGHLAFPRSIRLQLSREPPLPLGLLTAWGAYVG